ncbi:hypothetical protein DPMN_026222 [Dreissena polymorpha]|uniref:Uncharacterized protein n=1 Tax=Dreissena polymorpha TaxID=45954 RepID=A0A9D4LQQ5_DREPO|nr:hypothetical protein DPMN_026222 [Dreissena polymorpha]
MPLNNFKRGFFTSCVVGAFPSSGGSIPLFGWPEASESAGCIVVMGTFCYSHSESLLAQMSSPRPFFKASLR